MFVSVSSQTINFHGFCLYPFYVAKFEMCYMSGSTVVICYIVDHYFSDMKLKLRDKGPFILSSRSLETFMS